MELFSKNETANNELSDTDEEEYEPVSGTSFQRHQYGYLPRFRRLQILHVYLWQLAYGTSEDAALCADAAAQQREEDAVDFRQEHYGWLTHLQTLPVNRFGEGNLAMLYSINIDLEPIELYFLLTSKLFFHYSILSLSHFIYPLFVFVCFYHALVHLSIHSFFR